MQNLQQTRAAQPKLVTMFGLAIGAFGFLLAFILAMLMLVQQGNPGLLVIWLVAVVATGACLRMHAKWRKSFDRMYAVNAIRAFHPVRREWTLEVEDVAFRDLPDTPVS